MRRPSPCAARPRTSRRCARSDGRRGTRFRAASLPRRIIAMSSSRAAALAGVLSHPAIWRGADCAPEPAALPTGHGALDRALPGGGWPQGGLTEMLLAQEGIGELRLMLPALARLTHEGRAVVWIAPPHRPYAPALAA